jgi:hypothetical protein
MVLHRPFRHFVKGLDRHENSFMPVHTGSGDELCDTPMCPPVHSDSIPNTSL